MTQPLTLDTPAFRGGSNTLAQKGRTAGSDLSKGVGSSLTPPASTSPVGYQISLGVGGLQTGLSPAGPALATGSGDLNDTTQQGMSSVENQDAANAAGFPNGDTPGAPGLAGSDTPGELDPESIDEEAQNAAEDMLDGDQMTQMMQQGLQTGIQTGTQIAQQFSQQLSQLSSKLGEVVGKAGEQIGQLTGKVAQAASEAASAAPDLGLSGLGASGLGGLGAGLGAAGATIPAGMETPVKPMNTSSALQPSALKPPGGAPSTPGSMNGRMPMMPFMPMRGKSEKDGDNTTKRDPAIFPDDKIYDPPQGVEQTFVANPEIES